MKKAMRVFLFCLLGALIISVPVFAADVPTTKEAKKDLPNNFTDAYGVQFNVTMGNTGFYIAGIYVDVDSQLGQSDAVKVYNSSNMATYLSGFTTSNKTTLDVASGKTATFVYSSKSPLFTSNSKIAAARIISTGGDNFTVNSVQWLDKDGKPLTASSAKVSSSSTTAPTGAKVSSSTTASAANPTTGDNMPMETIIIVSIFVVAAGVIILATKRSKANS